VEWNGASSKQNLPRVGNDEGAGSAAGNGRQARLGAIEDERNVSAKAERDEKAARKDADEYGQTEAKDRGITPEVLSC
jgi:hypothetical protein